MTSNDRFRELLLQDGDYLDRIQEAWRLADSTMLEFQVAGMKRHTGGYEKIAADERASARQLVAEYHDKVVMPLLPLVDEMLQWELIELADLLYEDIKDPRRPWSTRYRQRRSKLDRLLYARSAKAERQTRLTLDDLSDAERNAEWPSRSPALSLEQFGETLTMDARTFKKRAEAEWDLQPDGSSDQRWTVSYENMDRSMSIRIEQHAKRLSKARTEKSKARAKKSKNRRAAK